MFLGAQDSEGLYFEVEKTDLSRFVTSHADFFWFGNAFEFESIKKVIFKNLAFNHFLIIFM